MMTPATVVLSVSIQGIIRHESLRRFAFRHC